MYDDKVRDFVKDIGIENIGKRLVNSREGAVSDPPSFLLLAQCPDACYHKPFTWRVSYCHA